MSGRLLCYNRSCGKTYNEDENNEDSCQYHCGAPFFHDTYKGWSCCNRKSVCFTEFLSIPGCTKGRHSNVKIEVEPELPLKIETTSNKEELPLEEKKQDCASVTIPTAAFDDPLVLLSGSTSVSVSTTGCANDNLVSTTFSGIKPDETCKNGGCQKKYSDCSIDTICKFHAGVPVFHEGMKYWSCCERKTSDFQAFMEQIGCTTGSHKWKADTEIGSARVRCRYDWHQTGRFVCVAIYAKNIQVETCFVKANPVRLKVHLYLSQEAGSFDLDLHLCRMIKVEGSSFNITPSKLEIKLQKFDCGQWSTLDLPITISKEVPTLSNPEPLLPKVDPVDLNDFEFKSQCSILSNDASGGRTGVNVV